MERRIKGGPFVVALTKLRGHIRTCYECRSAVKGDGSEDMCATGRHMTLKMAHSATQLAGLHRKAHDNPGDMIYPCPDIHKHGAPYAQTAMPYMATAVQEELF